MNAPSDRRTVLRQTAWAALLPVIAQMPQPASATDNARFAPPPGPMRYSRTLARQLAGGSLLVVERSFAVRFMPTSDGFALDGQQIDAKVKAPAALAQLAEVERARIETSLFPVRLHADGRIADGPDRPLAQELDQALAIARTQIARAGIDGLAEPEAAQFILALQQSAASLLTALPTDLFAPAAYPRFHRGEVPLPDGTIGEILARFDALVDPATGVMRSAERRVVTIIADDRRETVESWALTPL